MNKLLSGLSLLLLSVSSFAVNKIDIYANSTETYYDLSGDDGLECRSGEDGQDSFIYFDEFSELSLITLNQKGGKAGKFTSKCDRNDVPRRGEFGEIYLIQRGTNFLKSDPTRVISLQEFSKEDISLSANSWEKDYGTWNLFSKESKILPYFYYYKGIEHFKVKLKWSASASVDKFATTKFAFSVKGDKLSVTTYSGPIMDYRVYKNDNVYVVEVLDGNSAGEFKNLSFGKLRSSGEDMTLEVIEHYTPQVHIDTDFVITLFTLKDGKEVSIGYFKLNDSFITKSEDKYIIKVGKLKFPNIYKLKGEKLRVHLSIYRTAREQTRVFGLKGTFKI